MADPLIATAEPRLVETLAGVLRGRPEVRLALLFGSRARGRARPGSDVDIAVEGDGIDRLALARDLSLAIGAEVDVVDLSKAGYPLLNAVLRDGILIHEGEKHAAARWRTRAILQTETDRPWYERMRDAYLKRLAGEAEVESMLRDEHQRQRVERLFEAADRLAAVGEPPLTDAEIEVEVRAVRASRRR